MPTLEAGSIDAVITDLPYGTTSCAWDTVIPFVPMWEAVKHVLKTRGAFVTTASQPFTSALVMSNISDFRYEWIWEKPKATGHLDARRRPLKAHENIVVFGGETYNPTMTKGARYKNNHKPGDTGDVYGEVNKYSFDNPGVRFPRSIFLLNHEQEPDHPTQKPVALYEYLIKTYTNPGETVLDITMGSGTTGVACIQTGRNFIGIEKERKYFEIAENRIANAQPPLFVEHAKEKHEPVTERMFS
jgi:site-specific DNA-methyltransferase (adenine-specific)